MRLKWDVSYKQPGVYCGVFRRIRRTAYFQQPEALTDPLLLRQTEGSQQTGPQPGRDRRPRVYEGTRWAASSRQGTLPSRREGKGWQTKMPCPIREIQRLLKLPIGFSIGPSGLLGS